MPRLCWKVDCTSVSALRKAEREQHREYEKVERDFLRLFSTEILKTWYEIVVYLNRVIRRNI